MTNFRLPNKDITDDNFNVDQTGQKFSKKGKKTL